MLPSIRIPKSEFVDRTQILLDHDVPSRAAA